MKPTPAPSDAELIARYVQQRSQDAFALLVNRYVDVVYATAVRQVGDRHAAEDVTQAVFLLLADKAAGFDPRVVLPGWLYRAARLTAKDAVKMRRRRLRHERAAARVERVEPAADRGPSPELEAALDRLSAADRDALLLRYWQGLAVGEVARRLGVAENTAAKRLERAVARLRSRLTSGGAAAGGSLASLAVPAAPAGLATACTPTAGGVSPAAAALARRAAAGARWPAAAAAGAGLAAMVVAAYVVTAPPPRPAPNAVAAAVPPPPLVPASVQQQEQVRAAVYRFRHYDPFGGPPDWPDAIRTLVNIGRPAVPELVAELDRTDKDSTLRAIGYTLRNVPDPRAVPAMIRALRRTPLVSSDLGLTIADPGLSAFMHAHQPDPSDPYVDLGQASREILGALHAATRHSEGETFHFRGGPIDDAELAAAGRRRDALADAWQRWWDGHRGAFVTDAELATLTATPHDAAGVEAAGVAADGPLFPTGSASRLGTVHDVWVADVDAGDDLPSRVSFDREQVLSTLDALRLLPAGSAVSHEVVWWGRPPVSVDADCQGFAFPLHPASNHGTVAPAAVLASGPMRTVEGLQPLGVAVWPVADAVWDTLPRAMAEGRAVLDGVAGPYDSFSPTHVHPAADGAWQYPATFLFRTAGGRAGAVKLLASDGAARRLHLLYRMVDAPTRAAAAPPPLPAGTFGPVRTVVVPAGGTEGAFGLALSSGEVRPVASPTSADDLVTDRLQRAGADVTPTSYYRQTTVAGVRLVGATVWPVSDAAFDTLSAGMVAAATSHPDPSPSDAFLMATGRAAAVHRTAVFRTRDGTAGVAQVVSVSDAPPSATIRFKLLATATTTKPARN